MDDIQLYCPITNAIFQYSKINLLVKDTGTGGGEREGFQGKMQHKKWKGKRMFLRSK